MIRSAYLAVILVLTACGGGGGGSAPLGPVGFQTAAQPTPAPSPTQTVAEPVKAPVCTVALYGDSILNGGVFPSGHLPETPAAYVRRLRPRYVVDDYSVTGDTAQAHLGPFLNDPHAQRFTVIEYGVNDAGAHYSYEVPLRTMIQRVKATGGAAIVTGLSEREGGAADRDAYDAIAKRVASEESATFANWGDVTPVRTLDGLHPDSVFSAALSQRIVDVLDKLAPECK